MYLVFIGMYSSRESALDNLLQGYTTEDEAIEACVKWLGEDKYMESLKWAQILDLDGHISYDVNPDGSKDEQITYGPHWEWDRWDI